MNKNKLTRSCKTGGCDNDRMILTKRSTGEQYLWTYCSDCEKLRQQANRLKRLEKKRASEPVAIKKPVKVETTPVTKKELDSDISSEGEKITEERKTEIEKVVKKSKKRGKKILAMHVPANHKGEIPLDELKELISKTPYQNMIKAGINDFGKLEDSIWEGTLGEVRDMSHKSYEIIENWTRTFKVEDVY